MATLHHEVWIDAPIAEVYGAISTPDRIGTWWDEQKATADGTVLEHDPGPEHGVVRLKVLERTKDRRVEWECVSRHGPKSPASAWTGTHIAFELTRRNVPGWSAKQVEKTILDFRHSGWDERSEFFGFCNFAWGEVLRKLQEVCEADAKR